MEANLFELTEEQISTSKMMYDGKVIKCLVAPYHSYKEMEEMVPYTETTYLFPEKEMSVAQVRNFISMVVASDKITDEVRIITTSQNIIMDMVDGCVRVLTEGGDVVPSPEKTFMANIHTIRHCLLENEDHQLSKEEKSEAHKKIEVLIDKINDYCDNNKTMNKNEYDGLITKIKLIGEPIIRNKLLDMARSINVTRYSLDKTREELLQMAKDAVAELDVETSELIISEIERRDKSNDW